MIPTKLINIWINGGKERLESFSVMIHSIRAISFKIFHLETFLLMTVVWASTIWSDLRDKGLFFPSVIFAPLRPLINKVNRRYLSEPSNFDCWCIHLQNGWNESIPPAASELLFHFCFIDRLLSRDDPCLWATPTICSQVPILFCFFLVIKFATELKNSWNSDWFK